MLSPYTSIIIPRVVGDGVGVGDSGAVSSGVGVVTTRVEITPLHLHLIDCKERQDEGASEEGTS